jgi:hypothetical protein
VVVGFCIAVAGFLFYGASFCDAPADTSDFGGTTSGYAEDPCGGGIATATACRTRLRTTFEGSPRPTRSGLLRPDRKRRLGLLREQVDSGDVTDEEVYGPPEPPSDYGGDYDRGDAGGTTAAQP